MSSASARPLAITCGDPAGVGPEIIEAWLRSTRPDPASICVIGSGSWLRRLGGLCEVCAVGADFEAKAGVPTVAGAQVALAAMQEAALGCKEGRYCGVVTAPVSKHWLAQAGYAFPGQTEFFANQWGGQPTMAFAGGRLAVVLATWHIPLMQVGRALTKECLTLAVERAHGLGQKLSHTAQPRIGVCGLNPHAGEGGLLGSEERDFIDPWLDGLRTHYAGLSRALPGDTVFRRQLEGEFDVVVALYHDQGLAPLKTLEFDKAVNLTLGLPYVRTSPDHGTAFEIAGKGSAEIGSFARAVELSKQLI